MRYSTFAGALGALALLTLTACGKDGEAGTPGGAAQGGGSGAPGMGKGGPGGPGGRGSSAMALGPSDVTEAKTVTIEASILINGDLKPIEEIAVRSIAQALRADATLAGFSWRFRAEGGGAEVEGTLTARPEDFVGLRYDNPPGGDKHCLNTKIADCDLTVRRKRLGRVVAVETLRASRRAAFEILTEDRDHGIPIRA